MKLRNLNFKGRRRGFTMVEIALCLAIIGFALVAIIGVLPIGLSAQKDNREETIINFDANFLMNTIRSGAVGQDDLTNYVLNITNYHNQFTNPNPPTLPPAWAPIGPTNISWYTLTGYALDEVIQTGLFLTNGSNIIGLLNTPKLVAITGTSFMSNYITADFRSLTGSPLDHGTNQASYDFAFAYRLYPEIIPDVTDRNLIGLNIPATLYAQRYLYDIRLRFRWPIFPGGGLGNGLQTYRTSVSSQILAKGGAPTLYFFQPQIYSSNADGIIFPQTDY